MIEEGRKEEGELIRGRKRTKSGGRNRGRERGRNKGMEGERNREKNVLKGEEGGSRGRGQTCIRNLQKTGHLSQHPR